MSETSFRVTPEQLIALNDEIAMLVQAGVPLELGLHELGGSVKSALGKVNRELAQRLREGQPLAESFAATLPGMPRIYSAVIDAGLKSGNLPRALESLSRFAQQGLELRQRIEFAFLYPLMVFSLAYVLFLTFVMESADRWQQIWGEFAPTQDYFVDLLSFIGRNSAYWVWIPPSIVASLVGWWLLSARYSFLPDRRPSGLLVLIPGLSSIVEYWHWSNFCDLLATLLEHQVPLPTALTLAADATGSIRIHTLMASVAEDATTGRSMSECLRGRWAIPAYLRWSLGSAQTPAALQSALRHARELYRNRANFRADVLKLWLPLVTVLVVGGGAALFYALSLALPMRALFWQLNLDSMR